jgi:hypothetical protein
MPAGVFRYAVPVTGLDTRYMLGVVVRERDYTVLHFVYRRDGAGVRLRDGLRWRAARDLRR